MVDLRHDNAKLFIIMTIQGLLCRCTRKYLCTPLLMLHMDSHTLGTHRRGTRNFHAQIVFENHLTLCHKQFLSLMSSEMKAQCGKTYLLLEGASLKQMLLMRFG